MFDELNSELNPNYIYPPGRKTISRWNTLLCSLGWHKWTLWGEYKEERGSNYWKHIYRLQNRQCVICGKMQNISAEK